MCRGARSDVERAADDGAWRSVYRAAGCGEGVTRAGFVDGEAAERRESCGCIYRDGCGAAKRAGSNVILNRECVRFVRVPVTIFPLASSSATTGCVPNATPAVWLLGLVVNASFDATPTTVKVAVAAVPVPKLEVFVTVLVVLTLDPEVVGVTVMVMVQLPFAGTEPPVRPSVVEPEVVPVGVPPQVLLKAGVLAA